MRTGPSNRRNCSLPSSEISKTCTLTFTNSRRSEPLCHRRWSTGVWSTSGAWMGIFMPCSRSCAGVVLCVLLAGLATAQQQKHDREFWRGIAKHHYEVPSGESASALAGELSAMLASPDPELRDDLAYSILARWIYRGNL